MMTNVLQPCCSALNIMKMYICTGFFLSFVSKMLSSAKKIGWKSSMRSLANFSEMIAELYYPLMKRV